MPVQGPSSAWQLLPLTAHPDVRLDRAGHSATVLPRGQVLIAAGRRGSAIYNDVLLFESATCKIGKPVATFPPGMPPRAMHSATLVGNLVWFIGGMDNDDVFSDVYTLDIRNWQWNKADVRDKHQLLTRTAHAAEVHPHYPSVILISGGYGYLPGRDDASVHTDITLFDTQSRSIELLVPHPSPAISPPRCHHTMNILGDRVYLFGGRGEEPPEGCVDANGKKKKAELCAGQDLLSVFDLNSNTWLPLQAAGEAPTPRSSHRSVTLSDRMVFYGGTVQGPGDTEERVTDIHSLVVRPDGSLLWSSCDVPAQTDQMPEGRSAHTLSLLGDTMVVLCGYNGQAGPNGSKRYGIDTWALRLLPDAFQRAQPRPAATAAAQAAGTGAAQCQHSHKRHAAAGAAAATAAAGGRGISPQVAATAGGGAEGGAAGPWHTVKRQRSGGKDRHQNAQQGQEQQQQIQQLQQQPQASRQQQQQQQQHNGAYQRQQQQQPQPQQQQQQQPMQGQLVDISALADALTAAQIMVGAPGSRSPLRAGSPLRDTFGNAAYLQQEVDSLRDKLQDSIRQSSTLEAEVRFLKQQLSEAKAEARHDKQQAELKLQDRQMELARQATLLEQATVRSRRAAEEVTVAQQDLSTAKQQLQRAELERDGAQQQLQSLHSEVRKLRGQHAEAEQQVRQLQLQVQQQQEQERRLQEQLTKQRQQQQEEGAATRASIEQHRIELRRLNDTMADQKQKYDAMLQQQQDQATAQQQKLQEATQQLQQLQRQLQEAQAAAADAKKQKDDAVQLQVCTRDQYNTLTTTYKGVLAEKTNLETELAKLRDEQEHTRRELEQRRAAANNMQAAMQQVQTAMQQAMTASNQLGGSGVR